MREIDCCGLSCPIPVLNVKKALKNNPEGICVKVDNRAAKENISRLAATLGYDVDVVEETNGIWIMKIEKK